MSDISSIPKSTPQKSIRLNLFQQWKMVTDPRSFYQDLTAQYSDFAPVQLQGQNNVMPMSPEAIQAVFAADPNGYDAFWADSFSGLTGEGSLWVMNGEKHRLERLLFAPAVHARYFRDYGTTIRESVKRYVNPWPEGLPFRAMETTLAIALDVIMQLIFGVVDEVLMDEGRKVMATAMERVHPSFVFFPRLQRSWFPLWRRYDSARRELYIWFDRIIALRRAHPEIGGDVLSVLISARDEDGQLYDDQHIKNELLAVLSAGHLTTAVALGWALYELGRHPEVVEKLRAELASIGSDPDPKALIGLPYLSAVFNETVRLHPILSECARVANRPMEVHGQKMNPGQAFVISIVGIHHNPEIYPDPYRFDPERFINHNYDRFEFLPFGGGHRRCLGAGLAEYTIRIALAEIVQRWDLETLGEDFDIRHDLAMGPKHGIRMRARKRISESAP